VEETNGRTIKIAPGNVLCGYEDFTFTTAPSGHYGVPL